MMKKFSKIFKILILITLLGCVCFSFCQTVQAWDADFDQFDNKDPGNSGNTVSDIVGALINVVSIISAGIAIIMLIFTGMSYIGRGPEGKADAKKGLSSYVIGAVLLFAASGILKLLQMFIDSNVNNI
ncbi:MAG: hypothetical protein HFJ45_00410 [Clostridia bacterium]|nr:hypothetical protein [Clostridia bacterium]